MNKRTFLNRLGIAALMSLPGSRMLAQVLDEYAQVPTEDLASDESFWKKIRKGYRLKPDYINLENGYYNFLPEPVLERFVRHVKEINYQGSHYMRQHRFPDHIEMRKLLAQLLDCSHEEVAITRNTTESMDTVINGISWHAGDEAIMAEQDYFSMIEMFKLMERRYGIIRKMIDIPNHPHSDEEIVDLYASQISPRTRLLLVPHMVNISGQILPIKKICAMAHDHGIEVLVDGAHTVGQFPFSLSALGCDYFGSSLHKWLSVPLGAGLLYVKKHKIPGLWQMYGNTGIADDDIRKLNHTGTHPCHTDLTIRDSIQFYQQLGPSRKETRLRYLQTYLMEKLAQVPGILINTPWKDPARYCGISNIGVRGVEPTDLAKMLLDKYKIYTVAINGPGVFGCRITPNVYTTLDEMSALAAALTEISLHSLSK
jgi:selenocysteine lyase/cysteine desulfurase